MITIMFQTVSEIDYYYNRMSSETKMATRLFRKAIVYSNHERILFDKIMAELKVHVENHRSGIVYAITEKNSHGLEIVIDSTSKEMIGSIAMFRILDREKK